MARRPDQYRFSNLSASRGGNLGELTVASAISKQPLPLPSTPPLLRGNIRQGEEARGSIQSTVQRRLGKREALSPAPRFEIESGGIELNRRSQRPHVLLSCATHARLKSFPLFSDRLAAELFSHLRLSTPYVLYICGSRRVRIIAASSPRSSAHTPPLLHPPTHSLYSFLLSSSVIHSVIHAVTTPLAEPITLLIFKFS